MVPHATKVPTDSGVLDQATLVLVPLNLDGYPTPRDPVQRLVPIDGKSGVEKQLATLDPPPDSILAGRISLQPDGSRFTVSFVRQHGKIYRLEGFDESTSWFDRPTDAAILAGRNGSGPDGRPTFHYLCLDGRLPFHYSFEKPRLCAKRRI